MEISQDHSASNIKIQSYQAGCIKINGTKYRACTAITNEIIHPPLSIDNIESLSIKDLEALDFKAYEVILIGTGEKLIFPEWDLIEEAQCLGSPLEVMSTGAACRTFTILSGEGRKVLAVLLP